MVRWRTADVHDQYTQSNSERTAQIWCGCRLGCTIGGAHISATSEYDWTASVWRRCGLLSNYFDHLL